MTSSVQSAALSACLNSNSLAAIVWEQVTPTEHFTGPLMLAAEACYVAWQKYHTNEPHVVQSTLVEIGYSRRYPSNHLLDLYQNGVALTEHEVGIVIQKLHEETARRRIAAIAQRLAVIAADSTTDAVGEAHTLATELATVSSYRSDDPLASTRTLADLFEMDFEHGGQVIDGMFQQQTRVVLTGPEGMGKSELIFQIALGLACGLHPFDTTTIPQGRVLVVDAENDLKQLQGRLRRILDSYKQLGGKDPADHLRIQNASGWNLIDPVDSGHLYSMVRSFQPSLLVIGPIYKIMDGDQNDAEVVRKFIRVVDECRLISGCAVLTEAHAGHGEQGSRNGWRPAGSSYWLRWPDLGIGMKPLGQRGDQMELVRWRGDRQANSWPETVARDGALPWTEFLR